MDNPDIDQTKPDGTAGGRRVARGPIKKCQSSYQQWWA